MNKYYFDWFNENVLARGTRGLGDRPLEGRRPDDRSTAGSSTAAREPVGCWPASRAGCRSGYLYHYAFAMIIGLAALVGWLVFRP